MAQATLPENDIAAKLDAAGDLVAKGWTQGAYAWGKKRPVQVTSRAARCFCALGAIGRVRGFIGPDVPEHVALAKAIGGGDWRCPQEEIFEWNDAEGRTQDEVVAAFRKAAELARSQVSA